MRIRSGYSFRTAVGALPDVMSRLMETEAKAAPISDRLSTFAFTRWTKLAKEASLKPIYGVELAVVPELGLKKPPIDYWSFFAIDSLRPLHDLIALATSNPGRDPSLLYRQALGAPGLVKIAGERLLLQHLPQNQPWPNFYVALAPSTPKGLVLDHDWQLIASSDNYFPRPEDQEFYRVTLGRRAGTQTYPMHILSDAEWQGATAWISSPEAQKDAIANRNRVLLQCNATMRQAKLLVPAKPLSLQAMCVDGARTKGVDLSDPIYGERLERELRLIAKKDFEDYFYILADIIKWARARMIVGPARGSSCGSLVCYLLDITTIDPIPYGLIFERFIDLNRKDLPDIDVDFSDVKRHLVFEYAEQQYGADHVARLGTVGMFKPRSAIKQAGAVLHIPGWRTDKMLDSIIERSSADARAMNSLEDTLNTTEPGRKLLAEHPELLIATRMEGHPNNASQHAAGLIITDEPVQEYVAVDARTKAAWCDKKDSEDLNLLKIDALGLTQLSIFERCLELMGERPNTGFLERIPLDDPLAFAVLNQGHFSGIFQFAGQALRSLSGQIKFDSLEDIVAMTALARPGPLASGGANAWIKRKRGEEPPATIHPMLSKLTEETFGVVVYQETVMRIVREMGQFSWEDTSAIRKAMSGRLGDEFFEKYRIKFLAGAAANGVEESIAGVIWKNINTYGCLSGETLIPNPYSNGFIKNRTIKELAGLGGFTQGRKSTWPTGHKTKKHSRDKRCKALSLIDGTIKPQPVVDAYFSGTKETFRLKVDSGESIRATRLHRFLTKSGKWKSLGALRPGDLIVMVGTTATTTRKMKKWTGSGAHNWRFNDNIRYSSQVKKLRHLYKTCQRCQMAPYQETHHKDGNHENHEWENLLPVCRKCHKALHFEMSGRQPAPYDKGKSPRSAMIISIDDPRMEDTYDISMPAPNHNYLANGFIVHNSWAFNRCLDGETEIRLSHAAGSHVKTIAKLYDEYEADPSHWILQQRSKPWLISLTPEGRGLPQMAVRVLRNGLRQCIDLQFDDGSSVVCTKDHRFLINDRWQPCSVAQPGDKFASLIKKIWSHGKILSEKRLVSKAKIGLRETYDIELPEHHNFMLANGLITHNSHAVAYGIVSYWCCWLKAHHPLAFAAATLDAESDPQRQIATLRELALEGVSYVPVDPSHSGERWEIANGQTLVGPLTAIKGIGPAKVREIIEARAKGGELRPALLKQLQQAKTEIDSLFPIADAVRRLHPDLAAINIFTEPTPVVRVQPGLSGDVVILALVKRIAPRDENDSIKVTKRGYKVQGPAQALNLFLADDTDEIFCKVDRFNFERLGRKIMEEGRSGKSLYAIKGQVPSDFRMIKVKAVRYLGEIDK